MPESMEPSQEMKQEQLLSWLHEYENWRRDIINLTTALTTKPGYRYSEDLGDWVHALEALLTFAPHPPSEVGLAVTRQREAKNGGADDSSAADPRHD